MSTSDAPSSTAVDSQSVYTVTDSMRERILQEVGGKQYTAVNENYTLPFDDRIKCCERLADEVSRCLHGDRTTPSIFEPEGRKGEIARTLRKGGRVLDVGCGMEGPWIVAMCDLFPEIEGIGVDLVPIVRDFSPPNVTFETSDINEEGLLYPADYFDVVHLRHVIPWLQDKAILEQVRRVLRPGGVLLLEEAGGELHGADGSPRMPSWLHHNDNEPSWRQRFDGMRDLIASLVEDAEDVESTGWFEEVVEVRKMLHQGRRTSEPDDDLMNIGGILSHEALIGYFLSPVKDVYNPTEAVLRNQKRLAMFPPVDGDQWQDYILIWARKDPKEEVEEQPEGFPAFRFE